MIVEEKILEKIRKVLYSDAVIDGYINKRVYASHISSIVEPKYPAISLHIIFSKALFEMREFIKVSLQIDIWLQSRKYSAKDYYKILERIRLLLDRRTLTDTDIGVTFAQCDESSLGNVMYEEDTQLLHIPIIFTIVAR